MSDSDSSTDLSALEQHLATLCAELRDNDTEERWSQVQVNAQTLANALRIRTSQVDSHTLLGRTALPQTITSLFTLALHEASIPSPARNPVVYELLRVGANLCMDHDDNRGYLLEAGFPQVIVTVLEGYTEHLPPLPFFEPLDLPIHDIKIIKTAIGVLLNASLGYDGVKSRLNSLEAALTILKLSAAIYPPGSWSTVPTVPAGEQSAVIEEWTLRAGLSNWAWRTITELKDIKDDMQIFNPDVLPLLTPPLLAFIPPFPPQSSRVFDFDSSLRLALIQADFDVLEECCMLLESLSLDVEDVRLSLARGFYFPAEHGGVTCLSTILEFVEHGSHPLTWNSPNHGDTAKSRKEKAFGVCKGALVKSVVEVAGEDRNQDVLWDDSEDGKPGGEFVGRMVSWIKRFVVDSENVGAAQAGGAANRDDLAICASLTLGNLARREKNTTALLQPPHSLAPILTSKHLLSPDVDIKLKHGVVGLLKHLAQSSTNSESVRSALADANVIQSIVDSGVWDGAPDTMADIVQLSAIGVVKHMCNASAEHSFVLALSPKGCIAGAPTGLAQLMVLVKRSDSVPIKSEGTRVLVNVVKSLWSNDTLGNNDVGSETQSQRKAAMSAVLSKECALALAGLVGRSSKYPLLVNEGVVSLSLLSTQAAGAALVNAAIVAPLNSEAPSSTELSSASSVVSSPVVATPPPQGRTTPRNALEQMSLVLRNVDCPVNYPVEIRLNVCSFLLQLGKHAPPESMAQVQESLRPALEQVVEICQGLQGKEELLGRMAKRVLDAWV